MSAMRRPRPAMFDVELGLRPEDTKIQGIGIGSSMDDIIPVLGKPTSAAESVVGDYTICLFPLAKGVAPNDSVTKIYQLEKFEADFHDGVVIRLCVPYAYVSSQLAGLDAEQADVAAWLEATYHAPARQWTAHRDWAVAASGGGLYFFGTAWKSEDLMECTEVFIMSETTRRTTGSLVSSNSWEDSPYTAFGPGRDPQGNRIVP